MSTLSLRARLTLGFAALLALLLSIAVVGALALARIDRHMKQVVEWNNLKTEQSYRLLAGIGMLGTQVRNISLFSSGWKSASTTQRVEREMQTLAASEASYAQAEAMLARTLEASRSSAGELQLFNQILRASQATLPLIRQAAKQAESGESASAVTTLNQQIDPQEAVWGAKVSDFIAMQQRLNAEAAAAAAQDVRRTSWQQAALVAVALVLGSLLAWRITRRVTRPVIQAMKVAELIAQGDLNSQVEVESHDETGRLLGAMASMQQQLRNLVEEIQHSARTVQAATADVAAGNTELSHRTELTAANLQEAASSLEQLTSAVRQTADSAQQADGMASEAAKLAARGGAAVASVVSTMSQLSLGLKKMTEIVATIDGIAFQTNILALNAAVEAARAGTHGRGFAVMANDVRSLAVRCADAARDVKQLIGRSTEDVHSSSRLVGDAERTVAQSVSAVQRVAEHIGGITAATLQQSAGIDLVNTSVSELDRMTGQNAALVEQSAAASQSLKEQADRLSAAVEVFHLHERVPAGRAGG